MTDQELKEIRERCGPGEISADHHDTPFYNDAEGHSRGGDPTDDWYVCSDGEIIYDHLDKTAALLLTDIPKLLDEIDRLNQVLDSYEKAVSVVIAADAHNCIECSNYRGLSEAFDILTELVTESDLDSDSNDRT